MQDHPYVPWTILFVVIGVFMLYVANLRRDLNHLEERHREELGRVFEVIDRERNTRYELSREMTQAFTTLGLVYERPPTPPTPQGGWRKSKEDKETTT